MMARDHSPLARAAEQVPDADVERHPLVKAALQDLARAAAAHEKNREESRKQTAVLHEVDSRLRAATDRLGRLRDQLPGVAESILLGSKLALQTEEEILAAIVTEERTIARTQLGRPAIDARLRAQRGTGSGTGEAETDAHKSLERARNQARLELAAQRL